MTTTDKINTLYAKLDAFSPAEVFAPYRTEQLRRLTARCEVLRAAARTQSLRDMLWSILWDLNAELDLRDEDEGFCLATESGLAYDER